MLPSEGVARVLAAQGPNKAEFSQETLASVDNSLGNWDSSQAALHFAILLG